MKNYVDDLRIYVRFSSVGSCLYAIELCCLLLHRRRVASGRKDHRSLKQHWPLVSSCDCKSTITRVNVDDTASICKHTKRVQKGPDHQPKFPSKKDCERNAHNGCTIFQRDTWHFRLHHQLEQKDHLER